MLVTVTWHILCDIHNFERLHLLLFRGVCLRCVFIKHTFSRTIYFTFHVYTLRFLKIKDFKGTQRFRSGLLNKSFLLFNQKKILVLLRATFHKTTRFSFMTVTKDELQQEKLLSVAFLCFPKEFSDLITLEMSAIVVTA